MPVETRASLPNPGLCLLAGSRLDFLYPSPAEVFVFPFFFFKYFDKALSFVLFFKLGCRDLFACAARLCGEPLALAITAPLGWRDFDPSVLRDALNTWGCYVLNRNPLVLKTK